jgi:DNA invertase Pin-like site-specific DNA recombinase
VPRPRKAISDPTRVAGYVRVSTEEQGDSGLGLAAQQASIEAEVARRDWTMVEVFTDIASGKSLIGRDGLAAALSAAESGQVGGIVVAKLDRLSRSLADFANLMARAQAGGWNVVALDLGIDLSTPAGEFMSGVLASAAQWERRIISSRTREALAAKKAAGARLGRPSSLPPEVRERIVAERAGGGTWQKIADGLNRDLVATSQGGARWYPSSVRAAYLAADTVAG